LDAPKTANLRVSQKMKSLREKVAAVLSAVLWTLGFFLAFVISSLSPYIWLPDFLLLLGFIPLLFIWKPGWPWLVFGVVNVFIGFALEVTKFLPPGSLPAAMRPFREHLSQYHVSLDWILVGGFAFLYGLFRILKGVVVKRASGKN